MSNFVRFGRWTAELYQRAIYIQQTAKPNCPDCKGRGATETDGTGDWEPDSAICPCWDPTRTIRIPLWRRPEITEPF